jgi:hypothetical protein
LSESCSTSIGTAFRVAKRRFAATVTIITTCDYARHRGMTATAVTFVSMEPPALVVCVNQKSLSHDVMVRAPRFCVNVLHRDSSAPSPAVGADLPSQIRFEPGRWLRCEDGRPFLADTEGKPFLLQGRRHTLRHTPCSSGTSKARCGRHGCATGLPGRQLRCNCIGI